MSLLDYIHWVWFGMGTGAPGLAAWFVGYVVIPVAALFLVLIVMFLVGAFLSWITGIDRQSRR